MPFPIHFIPTNSQETILFNLVKQFYICIYIQILLTRLTVYPRICHFSSCDMEREPISIGSTRSKLLALSRSVWILPLPHVSSLSFYKSLYDPQFFCLQNRNNDISQSCYENIKKKNIHLYACVHIYTDIQGLAPY